MINEAITLKTSIEHVQHSPKFLLGIINKLDVTYTKCSSQKKSLKNLVRSIIMSADNADHGMLLM